MAGTKEALMARGFDDLLAINLVSKKYTLGKLKSLQADDLRLLGIPNNLIDILHSETRPPIPPLSLNNVLHANRWRCCVCREENKAIIVHHILDWAISHDHSSNNLAVLCLEHHDHAHTKKKLSQNLNPDNIKDCKKKWEQEVKGLDVRALVKNAQMNSSCWYYFNHMRLFDLASGKNINFKNLDGFQRARDLILIEKNGRPNMQSTNTSYWYAHGNGPALYNYMKSLAEATISKIYVINVSDLMERSQIRAIARPDDIIFIQGAHIFKKLNKNSKSPGQSRRGWREVNGIRIEYVFDAWEATSNSAWGVWLSGTQSAGSLCHVKSIETGEKNKIILKCTALAISFGLNELKKRDYLGVNFCNIPFSDDNSDPFSPIECEEKEDLKF